MQDKAIARVRKIISPFQYLIEDCRSGIMIRIQLKSTNNKSYQHLLPALQQDTVQYILEKRNNNKIREEYKKGAIFINGQDITAKYVQKEAKEYMSSEILPQSVFRCFVSKVECLKLELINSSNLKYITFYFSQLKLIRVGNMHPKEMWQRAHSYFKEQIEGQFIELTVSGCQNYKQEVNIYGDIVRSRDKLNIKQKIILDGYTELSKNAQKYLNPDRINYYNELRQKAIATSKGFWQTSKNIAKSNNQLQQLKYKRWEEWIKENRTINTLKNQEEEIRNIVEECNKISHSSSKLEYNKIKVLMDVLISLLENQINKKYLKMVEEVVRPLCNILSNLQVSFYQHVDNLDLIKSINKIMIFLTFYHIELEKLLESLKGEKLAKTAGVQFEKCIRFIFKLCFLGNQTFNDKLFGKRKQNNYQDFNFENVSLQGFSSLSQCSDYEQGDRLSREEKKERKVYSAHQKIRINATNLLSFFFKHYPNIVENYWQMCVTSNILTADFLIHVKKLRLRAEETKMMPEQKREIVNLMRSNFGDHSLILLSIFEKNNRVRSNSITCVLNMIANFQGKKLIATTQSAYIEKLLKQTRSSFVPKSFIIFSGLRNALYFLLFALYYEKNVQIVVLIFKTLCQLCNNCTLIDKMSFEQGVGLLMSNYIVPVLEFQWSIVELQELKILCINFLSVLVNNNRKWLEIEQKYFKSTTQNINAKLMQVISSRKSTQISINQDNLTTQILNYFTKLTKRYYNIIFFPINNQTSIWTFLADNFLKTINHHYSQFIEEIFKGHLDEVQSIQQQNHRNPVPQPSIRSQQLNNFLVQYLKVYTLDLSPVNYLHILATLTYINYDYWSRQDFVFAKQFLLHCFYSFIGEKINNNYNHFLPIDCIQNNSLIRIALIKLVGYLSFCPQFQTDQITKKAVRSLLELSKQYKSLNCTVKISWGLSNWSKVSNFSTALTQQQLKLCLDYMMQHSQSDKQKIASNCTRGIGFFVTNIGKKFDLKDCRRSIIKNLTHSIIKVRTNSTKSLLSLSEDLTVDEIKDLIPILQQNILKNNYHLQMQTLQLLRKLDHPIKGRRLLGLFVTVLKNLMNCTTMEYEFSEIKTIKELRYTVLSEIFSVKELINQNQDLVKDILPSIFAYLTRDCREEQSKTQTQGKVIDKEFDKSQQAEKLIFNKSREEIYNDEKVITSKIISKGLVYKANPQDLQLITKIKQFTDSQKSVAKGQQQKLQGLKIEGSTVILDYSALQLSEYEQEWLQQKLI